MSSDEFQRWARFGVDQDGIKYIPIGGTCLINYLISRKGDSILVGKVNGKNQGRILEKGSGLPSQTTHLGRQVVYPMWFLAFWRRIRQERANVLVKDMLNAKAKSINLSKVISCTMKPANIIRVITTGTLISFMMLKV